MPPAASNKAPPGGAGRKRLDLLVLLSVDFLAWPWGVLDALEEAGTQVSARAFVTMDADVSRVVGASDRWDAVLCQSALEAGWMDSGFEPGREKAWKARLGEGAFDELVRSDRELAGHTLSGARTPLTPLGRRARDRNFREAYAAALLDALDPLFTGRRPDAVLSFPTQDAGSYAAGLLAAYYGVPFLAPKAIGLGAAVAFFDDVRTMRPVFDAEFHAAESDPSVLPASAWQAGERLLAEFEHRPRQPDYMRVANRTVDEAPDLRTLSALGWRTLTRRPPENLRYPFPLSRALFETRRWAAARRDRRRLRREAKWPLAAPYYYFPLHYEPEASTMVAAPDFVDQLALIAALAAGLPPGCRLAVKEHWPMLGRRPPGYYRRLGAIAGVDLVDPAVSGFEVMKAARATLTITGTAGLEAVLTGRPAAFFGPSPVQVMKKGYVAAFETGPGPELYRDLDRLRPAPRQDRLRFVATLLAHSVDIPSTEIWGGAGAITRERVAGRRDEVVRLATLFEAAIERAGRRIAHARAAGRR